MRRRSISDKDLLEITQRNEGKRKSLVLDDYDSIPPSPDREESDENISAEVYETVKISSKHEEEELHRISSMREIEIFTRRKAKPTVKGGKFRSRFGDVKFESNPTILDSPYVKQSEFYGIYILFWLSTGLLILNTLVHSYLEDNILFFDIPLVQVLRKDLFKVAFTDLLMYLTSYFAFFIQYLCLHKYISWDSSGWIIHSIFDFLNLIFWLYFASERYMGLPWIAKIFLFLHSIVFLMKLHAYGFYNGYLWRILTELEISTKWIEQLKDRSTDSLDDEYVEKTIKTLDDSIKFCTFELKYQAEATTLTAGLEENPSKVPRDKLVRFPANITLFNYFEYSMFPTAIYTLNFPRTSKVRWGYVFEKVCAIFGVIFLMIMVSQQWLYPQVIKCILIRELPLYELAQAYSLILMDMALPFLLIYLLTFYLIWEAILNAIAELSRFADRDFYGPWWSCSNWYEYSKIWNRPVHKFLLRHVYHSSISAFNLDKNMATLFTFMLSSLLHEMAMFVIFRRLRGYLLCFQMLQLPLIALSNTKFMKDKKVLGNVICWFGFITAPSLLCTLYLVF